MRSPLAYTPRPGRLQDATPGPAIAFLLAPALIAFVYSNPIVLVGAGAASIVAGLAARARAAVALALRWGATLAALIVTGNLLVPDRGAPVLFHGLWPPLLGSPDLTLEAVAAGGVLGLRIAVVMVAFGVYSACVDPDRVLGAIRPLAGRS